MTPSSYLVCFSTTKVITLYAAESDNYQETKES